MLKDESSSGPQAVTLDLGLAEPFSIRGDRTLFLESTSTLFVADVHLGKAATFRAKGIPIPEACAIDTLQRLTTSIDSVRAKQLVILGDLWHSRAGRTAAAVADFEAWRNTHEQLEIILVVGNHDRRSGQCPQNWRITEVLEGSQFGHLTLLHDPENWQEGQSYGLSGHLHPGVTLRQGSGRSKVPCFWMRPNYGVLPSFGSFTGCVSVEVERGDWVGLVAEQSLVVHDFRD